jgi:hypothetical protein
MTIIIHSSGRPDRQLSVEALSEANLAPTLLVQEKEFPAYDKKWGKKVRIETLPAEIITLSPTRQWIIDNYAGKVIMMDDDLRFCRRRKDDTTKFEQASGADIYEMFSDIWAALDTYTHVGVLAREGANRITAPYGVENTRMMRLLAYDTEEVRRIGARFDRLPTKQDFDMTLQLLRAGEKNGVLTQYCHDQPGSNTSGGCSRYRTPEVMESSAKGLAELHPGFVKVVRKATKGAWGGGERVDVQIQWKKAYESSKG